MKYFQWWQEVTTNITKWYKHIYDYRFIISQSLDAQVFAILWDLTWQPFCRGTENRQLEMNFENNEEKTPQGIIILLLSSLKISKIIYSAICEIFCRQKRGVIRRKKERKTLQSLWGPTLKMTLIKEAYCSWVSRMEMDNIIPLKFSRHIWQSKQKAKLFRDIYRWTP